MMPSFTTKISRLFLVLAAFLSGGFIRAQTEPTYWKDIRPIFRKHCTVCHSARNLKEADVSGGLALDSYQAVRKGSKKPIFVAGKSGSSTIMHLLETPDKARRMPLDASPLAKEKITLIRLWIDKGALEGSKPEETSVTTVKKPVPVRKRDVILPITSLPPAGTLGKGTGKLDVRFQVGPLAPVTAVVFSPDNKLLASASYGQVTIWDLATARPVKVLTSVLGAVNDLRFRPDGKVLAVAGGQPSAKGDLRFFRVSDWKLLGALRGHEDVIFSIDFSHDGKRLASASFDKTVRIWNVEQFKEERVLAGHSDFVYAVALSPDGKHVVSASKDRTVKMEETATGKSVFTFSGMDQDILAVAFSPDGKQVVSSGFEPGIYWWNPQTGERIKVQGGHGIAVNELRFSKDGSRLISAGSDRTLRIWNPATAAPVKTISVGSVVYACAISPNNKLLASGSFDGLVRVWEESTGRHLATLLSLPSEKETEWLALTPEGYLGGSTHMSTLGRWQVGGQGVPAARAWTLLNQPDQVARALGGQKLPLPKFGK